MSKTTQKQKELKKGYVYIFTSDSLQNMVKIGQTTDIQNRLVNASTWSPTGFDCVFALESERYKDIEKLVHFAYRHCWESGEFFSIKPEEAIKFFQKIVDLGVAKSVPADSLAVKSTQQFKKGDKVRADNTTFESLEIPVGAKLVFKGKPAEECETVDIINQVKYKGEIMSLSALASRFAKCNVSGYWYFKYKGQILWDIRLKKLATQNEFEFSGD